MAITLLKLSLYSSNTSSGCKDNGLLASALVYSTLPPISNPVNEIAAIATFILAFLLFSMRLILLRYSNALAMAKSSDITGSLKPRFFKSSS